MDHTTRKLNAISLFSGAMGFDLGIERSGFNIRLCVEWDKWACKTIKTNTNIPLLEGDITKFSATEILQAAQLEPNSVDLIFGGPPCQPFSSAGKRKGLSDLRSNTLYKFLDLVSEIKPKFFLLENVRGLLSAKLDDFVPDIFAQNPSASKLSGSVMYWLCAEFKKLGYAISFSLFNAANYGVPQKRERVIIFGALGDESIPLPNPTHFDPNDKEHEKLEAQGLTEWVSIKEAFGNWKSILGNFDEIKAADSQNCGTLRKQHIPYLSMLKGGQYWKHLPTDIQKQAMGKMFDLDGGKTGFLRRLSYDQPSPTLVTVPTMPNTMLCHPEFLRPLSIPEYARIQMFPSNWVFEGSIEQQYKQIGNAVPIGLGYIAGLQIIQFIETTKDSKIGSISYKYSRYKNTTDTEFLTNFEKQLT